MGLFELLGIGQQGQEYGGPSQGPYYPSQDEQTPPWLQQAYQGDQQGQMNGPGWDPAQQQAATSQMMQDQLLQQYFQQQQDQSEQDRLYGSLSAVDQGLSRIGEAIDNPDTPLNLRHGPVNYQMGVNPGDSMLSRLLGGFGGAF